ncbi:MAG: TerB family tellurite resistance protein [Gammaproteobacteria bacterium]|nr:TerB family tellurite resistance protein [Gammaproteobacteria bacterium]
MLDLVRHLLGEQSTAKVEPGHELDMAIAILLIEVARADKEEHPAEMDVVRRLLSTRFNLNDEERGELMARAGREAEHMVSLQGFTRQLVDALSESQRGEIIGQLWQVALSDGSLDPEEELLVRRIADLLYVRHSEFIRQKHLAEQYLEK